MAHQRSERALWGQQLPADKFRATAITCAITPAIAFCLASCSQNVTIPPKGQDAAPTITWNAFIVQQPSGYSGDVEPGKTNVHFSTKNIRIFHQKTLPTDFAETSP
jgi:hypothetical protein